VASKYPRVPIGMSNLVIRLDGSDDIGLAGQKLRVQVLEHLRGKGLDAVGAENLGFDKDETKRARFMLGGTINDLACWAPSQVMNCRLGVEWQLLDLATDTVVYRVVARSSIYGVARHEKERIGRSLILDAVDYGLAPGTLKLVENDQVPRFLGAKKMSLHQTGFQEVLALAQLTGRYPRQVLLVGCQPEELDDYGGSLRPVVRAALDRAVALAVERLDAWGGEPRRREQPPAEGEAVTTPELALQAYEAGRPCAQAACRIGDERFLAASAAPL
jgi:hydrogenase maturation protease